MDPSLAASGFLVQARIAVSGGLVCVKTASIPRSRRVAWNARLRRQAHRTYQTQRISKLPKLHALPAASTVMVEWESPLPVRSGRTRRLQTPMLPTQPAGKAWLPVIGATSSHVLGSGAKREQVDGRLQPVMEQKSRCANHKMIERFFPFANSFFRV